MYILEKNEGTNERSLFANERSEQLLVEAEAHQSWPLKNKKETDKQTKGERQRKKEKKNKIHCYT